MTFKTKVCRGRFPNTKLTVTKNRFVKDRDDVLFTAGKKTVAVETLLTKEQVISGGSKLTKKKLKF